MDRMNSSCRPAALLSCSWRAAITLGVLATVGLRLALVSAAAAPAGKAPKDPPS